MKTKIIFSLAIIGIVGVSAIGGTVAYFSDTEKSAGNVFTAGSLDLKIDHTYASYNGQECVKDCVPDSGINLVTNGDFETPLVDVNANSGAKWNVYPSVAGGWTVEWRSDIASFGGLNRPDPANLELHRGVLGPAHTGAQYAELDTDWYGPASSQSGEPASVKIYQNLATAPGQKYQISFAFAPRPNTAASENVLEIKWDGVTVDTITAAGGGSINWTVYTYQVTASQATAKIEFTDQGIPDSEGTFLDDVIVNPVSCSYQITGGNCKLWDLKDLDDTDHFWDFSDIKPKDRGVNVLSLHVNDNDAWVCLKAKDIVDNENDRIDPETESGDATDDPNGGELSQFIKLFAWDDTNNNGSYDPGESPLITANTPLSSAVIGKIALPARDTLYVGIAWCFGDQSVIGQTISCEPPAADAVPNINVSQTDSVIANLEAYATQQRNNPNFQCGNIPD